MSDGMNMKKEDPSGLAIGGGTMLGLGVGFFVFHISIFAFLGSLLGGIGLGMLVSSLISAAKRD